MALTDIVRQVAVTCIDRGVLLNRVFEAFDLQQKEAVNQRDKELKEIKNFYETEKQEFIEKYEKQLKTIKE